MRKEFLPFTKPAVTEEDIAAVNSVLRSGWLTNGPVNAEFETALAQLSNCSGAVAVDR